VFVAIGVEYLIDGYIAAVLYTSPDGIQWTQRLRLVPPVGFTDVYPGGIAHGNGRFVVVGQQFDATDTLAPEGITYTSLNGMQWTRESPTPSLSGDGDIAFGEAGFVLTDARRILTSGDGSGWQIRHELDESWFWRGVVSSGGRTVCLAEKYSDNDQERRSLAVVSGDGLSWDELPLSSGSSRRLYSDAGTIFAIGDRSLLSSPDGLAWTEQFTPHPLDPGKSLWDVVYGEQGFVAVGDEGSILTSRDGGKWETGVSGTSFYLTNVIHGSGRYVAAGANGTLIHSPDGQAWSTADLEVGGVPVTLHLGPLAHGAGRFVLLTRSRANGFFWTSDDGLDWQLRFSDTLSDFSGFSSMVHGNDRFVASGGAGAVALSSDGVSWERIVLPDPFNDALLRSLLFDGGQFLARAVHFGLLASQDGITWTVIDDNPFSFALGYGDGNLVATRAAGETSWGDPIALLDSSSDGLSWTTVAPFLFGGGSLSFAYGAGRFVGVGGNFDGTARLLISGVAAPQLDIRREAERLILTIRGAVGAAWTLQQSSNLIDWREIGSILLEADVMEMELIPPPGSESFWRLSTPGAW